MYNLTNITDNANNVYEIIKYTNDLTGGLFFTLMLLSLLIAYMAVFKKGDFKEVFLGGSFFIGFLSVMFFALGFVGQSFVYIPIMLFFAALFIYMFTKN